ncbi:MAG: N-acetyltransferase family protein [Candidatus Aminicenantaceae bacterium]
MEKAEILKDGTKVLIRDQTGDDLDILMDFYLALPAEDRRYLRVDVTDRDAVEQRLKLSEGGYLFRRGALDNDKIAATGALEIFPDAWRKHQGEIRVIVAEGFRHKGLGMVMMRELYLMALDKDVELLVTRMLRPQIAARNICRKLGFREELMVPDYLHDLTGATQDMVLMACEMKEFWKELEQVYRDTDWARHR